jgi:hypothetical protein
MDRICVGVAFPVRSALPAMLASALLGGFSGVVFFAICLLLSFERLTCHQTKPIRRDFDTCASKGRDYSVRT